jgi:peptidoglycan LD-endopeptidase LytH
MTSLAQNSFIRTLNHIWLQHGSALKKFVLGSAFLLLLLLLVGQAALISTGMKISNRMVMYVRVAPLYAQQPDSKLSMPVSGVARKQVADTWHAARGDSRRHEGQDIFAPRGTPVLSATDGYIVNIGENRLGGQTVSVIGAGGRVYYYAHLDSYAQGIAVGDQVTRQTVLGYVGTTGNAGGTPPHLHFGVYAAGGAMNPLPLLSDRTEKKTDERVAATALLKKANTKRAKDRMVHAGLSHHRRVQP